MGVSIGSITRVIKGDTRSFDNGSWVKILNSPHVCNKSPLSESVPGQLFCTFELFSWKKRYSSCGDFQDQGLFLRVPRTRMMPS